MTSTLPPLGVPLVTTAQLREVEADHAQLDLMRRAGKAAAEFVRARSTADARVVLFAGPGNNGGDALACASELASMGYAPLIVLLGDPEKFGEDAARDWRRVEERFAVLREIPLEITADWIIDGLFGIGLKRPLDGVYSEAVTAIAHARANGAKVLALDVPSGIDADTGATIGESVITADFTLTFIANKPGLVTGPALNHVGELHCADLDLAPLAPSTSTVELLGASFLNAVRKTPLANAHKGSHGTCVILGGSTGMLGAALLASRAAMRCGAGKVKLGWLADPAPQVDPQMPEVMMAQATDLVLASCDALVIGCGLGMSGEAVRLLGAALKREVPIIVDADALNLIAQSAALATLMQRRQSPTVITPHPAEAARLLGCSTAAVQADRLRAAADLARGYSCIAVIKGAGTVVCCAAGTTINGTGNPLLATAGTGDVLAGMIGALLAQGYAAATAARLAVCLHGAAADAMRGRGVKRAVASDVINALRWL